MMNETPVEEFDDSGSGEVKGRYSFLFCSHYNRKGNESRKTI